MEVNCILKLFPSLVGSNIPVDTKEQAGNSLVFQVCKAPSFCTEGSHRYSVLANHQASSHLRYKRQNPIKTEVKVLPLILTGRILAL